MKIGFSIAVLSLLAPVALVSCHAAEPIQRSPAPKVATTEKASSVTMASSVKVAFGKDGLRSLVFGGEELVVTDPGSGLAVQGVSFSAADGKVSVGDLSNPQTRWEEATKTLTVAYSWGEAVCRYQQEGDRLDLYVSLHNATPNTLQGVSLQLAKLRLPGLRKVELGAENMNGYGANATEFSGGVIGLGNWEVDKPVGLSLVGSGTKPVVAPLVLGFQSSKPRHEIVDARYFAAGSPIAPNATDSYHLSLNFAPKGTAPSVLNRPLAANYRRERPQLLNWKDRRPIGRLFLANPHTGWPTNPRGYLFGKGPANDVTTEAGLRDFGQGLMAYADQSIKVLKEMNAQGVIVWDLEGAEFNHPITYIGHPNRLPDVAPEMDRFADVFMAKLRSAGLKIGICIRPTEVFESGDPNERFRQRDVVDPVELMSEKIAYARKRWGCQLFYLDSNVFATQIQQPDRLPWTMPVEMIETLQKRFPDILLIPEWESRPYYAYSAPYHSTIISQYTTDPAVREVYPGAFSVLAANSQSLGEKWDYIVDGVRHGDVLFFDGWYPSADNLAVQTVYREAALPEKKPEDGTQPDLSETIDDAREGNPAERWFAIHDLGKAKSTEAVGVLTDLLDDTDALVQKQAIVALERAGQAKDERALTKLISLLTTPDLGDREFLRPFVTSALGTGGAAASGHLAATLADSNQSLRVRGQAARALGQTGVATPEAIDTLLNLLGNDNLELRKLSAEALGDLKVKEAVEPLIAVIQAPYDRDKEELKLGAVRALGKIGDERAIGPIIELPYKENFSTTAVYFLPSVSDEALQKLTGLDLSGYNEWREWRQKNAPAN